jgi:ATP-binding cassette subfamily B protein
MNAETVKYFTAEQAIRERLDTVLRRSEVEWLGFFKVRMWNGLLVATIFSMFLAVNILYAVWQVLEGRMSIGTFVLVNTYIFQIVAPVEMVGGAMQALAQGMAFLGKMLELFRSEPESLTSKQGGTVQSFSLRFDDVRVSYKQEHPILRGISFDQPAGKTLGVVGASGAGKSTLVRLLVRFIEPNEGHILVDGRPISELSLIDLRQAIAVVPQDTVLFDDSIAYNIAFGRLGASREEVIDAARLAQLHDSIMKMPDGYETKVGERGLKLSGGEKQRVSIARAAVKRPKMYIFDEATSSLDSRTEQDILQNIRAISRDSTTLIIAHRLSTVVHADNIIVLDAGRIIEQGNHEQLLALDGYYAQLWRAQQAQEREVEATA